MTFMAIDVSWARTELTGFLKVTELQRPPRTPGIVDMTGRMNNAGPHAEILERAHVVEQILDRVLPRWRTDISDALNRSNRWIKHREAATRTIAALDRDTEVHERLGDDAPQLSAAVMHPWAWEGARSLWQSGHFREAVTAAARKVNAETQNKVGRRDVSETKLFQSVFSAEAPKPDQPRLRVMTDDGSDTFKSVHRGLMAFAEGCYAAIRNPNSHEDGLPELPEHEALEQLAAFSFLARKIDEATLLTA
jgi:Protein of unknown function (Hypoth_ymh)